MYYLEVGVQAKVEWQMLAVHLLDGLLLCRVMLGNVCRVEETVVWQ